jgi:peptidoglycan/xylan/chitin deacetylase (PgdA/CDA1 family)
MQNAWYILLYHDVSWEENPYSRGLGITMPPDLLRDHLAHLSRWGEILSVADALDRANAPNWGQPAFSFWFDDGFAGVRQHALPLLDRYGAAGALSICSRFVYREELFWRLKLSFLSSMGGMGLLRTRLQAQGHTLGAPLRDIVLDRFSLSVVEAIDAVYREFTSEAERQDAFRLFETPDGLAELRRRGWTMANHSAAHYPVGEDAYLSGFASQFGECEQGFQRLFGEDSRFWVLPFDRGHRRAVELASHIKQQAEGRYFGLVGQNVNTSRTIHEKILHRIAVPQCSGRELVKYLNRIRG